MADGGPGLEKERESLDGGGRLECLLRDRQEGEEISFFFAAFQRHHSSLGKEGLMEGCSLGLEGRTRVVSSSCLC